MTAQHAALLEHEPDELARHARATLRFERGAADEIALGRIESDRPREARFERRHVLVHVVAVEIHASLEPQRVACAEPALRDAGGLEARPELRCFGDWQHDLPAIFAGVTGAR